MEEFPLRGVRLKLARARDHLETLKSAYGAFCERDPMTISMRYEDREYPMLIRDDAGEERQETRTHEYAVFRLHIQEHPPSAWSVIIGDCLQNARAAIEHLAWQLAYPEYGGSGPTRRTNFPIVDQRPHFWRTIEGVGTAANGVIESLQPYQRGADARLDPLWILNELARVDRHQVLHVAVAIIEDQQIYAGAVPGTRGSGAYLVPADISDELYERISRRDRQPITPEDNAEMATIASRHPALPHRRWTVGFEAVYFIVFSESEARITTGLPVIETLERILRQIESETLPLFGKFF
jgi:hypothetical protein